MPPAPIALSGAGVDLSPRVFAQTVTNRSPSGSGETVLVTLPVAGDIAVVAGILLVACLTITVGLNGTAVRLRVRRSSVAGAVIADTGPVADSAQSQVLRVALGFDSSPSMPGQAYVLTSETVGATNPSTLGAATLVAVAV